MSENLHECPTCKTGHLRPSGEVVIHGESVGDYTVIGSRRILVCDNCKQRQIKVGAREYIGVAVDIKTEPQQQ